ncbi:hypothetical protein [Luteolibacter luteus]|uniref:Thioredoxin family protein n=1 Tax=Luteolibacter luteus TaxID=2728835 RepID=A0A858RF64_9BACT|nr:hypothetical protein [Luteolibacter luteus]QJE95365.1 hypothetical protein HHL09_06085 [Luteolibacter luteus]
MKPFTLLALLGLSVSAHAEQEFPRGTFQLKDLDKAKAEAAAAKKPLAFIYTDKNTTCPLCQGAADEFLDATKSKAVIVYVDSPSTPTIWPTLPDAVKKGLEAGKFIPKIAVTDASAEKLITSLNYDAYKQDNKTVRDLKKALKPEK